MHAPICNQDATASLEPENMPLDNQKYEYLSKRSYLTKPNNIIESAIHMLMCGLGGGLVALHVAYMECGLFTSMALNVVLPAIVGYCVCMLVWSAQKLYGRVRMPKLTYPDVMEVAVLQTSHPWLQKKARKFRHIVELTLLCHLYGSCCVFIIMIALNLKELVSRSSTVTDGGEPSLKVIILSLMIPCTIICMVTDLKKLAPFALICDLFAVALVLVLLWYSLHDIKVRPTDRLAFKSVTGLVEFTCICIFVLEPVCYALPIENNMEHPEKFHLVVLAAMPIHTVAMMAVGFFGYWYFGENAKAPITVHLPISPYALILKVMLCIVLHVVYALCFYLAFNLEWYYLKRINKLLNHWFWERLIRALHVVVLIFIAYSLPNATRLMGIVGAFSTIPAVFIYPSFIDLLVNWKHPSVGCHNWRLYKCISIILLGLILCGAGTYLNCVGMYRELSSNTHSHPTASASNSQQTKQHNQTAGIRLLQPANTTLDERESLGNINGTEFTNDILAVNLSRGTDGDKNISTTKPPPTSLDVKAVVTAVFENTTLLPV